MWGRAEDKPESSNAHGLRILPKHHKDDTRISLMARAFSKCSVGFMLRNALVLDLCVWGCVCAHGLWRMALERLLEPYCLLIAFKEGTEWEVIWVNPVMLWRIDESLETLQFSLLQAAYYTGRWGKAADIQSWFWKQNHLVHVQQQTKTKALRVQLPSAWMNERIKTK